ncbi:MAG: hypothetical protein KDI82_07720 [Gammaproteobacteria bacterium]|nr:hypothetical protein [Gammaproteobacteria bacterium]
MTPVAELAACLGGWLQQRLAAGDDGKTLLVGFRGAEATFALAAGLGGTKDHPGFSAFARYLLHRRFHCDGHALLLPAALAGEGVYLLNGQVAGQATQALFAADGTVRDWRSDDWPIDRLEVPGDALPGIQRREMERLFEHLRVPPP